MIKKEKRLNAAAKAVRAEILKLFVSEMWGVITKYYKYLLQKVPFMMDYSYQSSFFNFY